MLRLASPPVTARVPGTFTAGAVLAMALLISIAGSLYTYREVGASFSRHVASEQAGQLVTELKEIQLYEETGLRGYLASGQRLFLQPYTSWSPRFGPTFNQLEAVVQRASAPAVTAVMIDLLHTHALWEADVARPLIARPASPQISQRLATGKVLGDRMRTDSDQLTKLFAAAADAETRQAQSLLAHAAEFTAALMLLFGAAAILADYVRSRTIAALERERTIADTLQRVFLSGWEHAPDLEIGTAYVSASLDAALGGDLFDVHSIDEHRTLLLVADISGKGIFAAVETALVKFSIRILVEDDPDPGSVLQKFNATYLKSADDPTSFVSVFVGILDHRTHTLRYANAGHGPVYVRREGMVEQLQVTGPLVGVRQDATFAAAATSIGAQDTIVLATDGLTEARDSSGMMLEDDRAMRWIADGQQSPQALADEIVNRIGKYAGGRITDDLALLVVRWANGAVPLQGTQAATAAPVSAALPSGPPAKGEPVARRST